MLLIVLLCVIALAIYIFLTRRVEGFVGYNVDRVNADDMKFFQTLNANLSSQYKNALPQGYTYTFSVSSQQYAGKGDITNNVANALKMVLQASDAPQLLKPLYGVFTKGEEFVGNVDFAFPSQGMVMPVMVYGKYSATTKQTTILYMTCLIPPLYTFSPLQSPIGDANLNDERYTIKNTLHLLDPYLTTGKEIEVTTDMRQKWDTYINTNIDMSNPSNNGICYGLAPNAKVVNSKGECDIAGGIWDTPPVSNSECPFFAVNKNYPNTFGGVNRTVCQMPRNVKLIGNKKYSPDPQFAPLCHSCKSNLTGNGSLGFCCDEQKDNSKYPKLLSPDYAFDGDTNIRMLYKDTLTLLDASVE
jgi:hypothetical protein